jgi:hypothetical protein
VGEGGIGQRASWLLQAGRTLSDTADMGGWTFYWFGVGGVACIYMANK